MVQWLIKSSSETQLATPDRTDNRSSAISYTHNGARYLNITNRCPMSCIHCPRANNQWDCLGPNLKLEREPTVTEILDAMGSPVSWREMIFGGLGEPMLRLYDLLEVARHVRGFGTQVGIKTCGLANKIYGRDITPDLEGNIDMLEISLHAHDQLAHDRYCRSKIADAHAAILDFIRRARDFVPHIRLTARAGMNTRDLAVCAQIAAQLDVEFAVSEVLPVYH